jgi:hypothetical protein
MFTTLDDVNVHLPTDKLELQWPDLVQFDTDAQRIIRGYLAGVYQPATIAAWTDPTITDPSQTGYVPELIRAIAGRFIAAFWYKERYSEDSLDVPAYAQSKYDEAMAMLMGLVTGTLGLVDVTEDPTNTSNLTADDFLPNANSTGPFFTMDDSLWAIPPTAWRGATIYSNG